MAALQNCSFAIRKNIKDFPLYSVDNWGEVRNLERSKTIAYSISHGGYYSVRCCKRNGKEKIHQRFLLHRLVLSSFKGKDPIKKYVDHKDDNPANNTLPNLRWATQSENIQKSFDLGRSKSPLAMLGKTGKKHHASMGVVGYLDGEEVVRFDSISLARKGGYNLDFYKKKERAIETICNGITFKRA